MRRIAICLFAVMLSCEAAFAEVRLVLAPELKGAGSAIKRLLRGKHGSALLQDAAYWRARYEEILGLVPAWLQARFRGLLAALPPAPDDGAG